MPEFPNSVVNSSPLEGRLASAYDAAATSGFLLESDNSDDYRHPLLCLSGCYASRSLQAEKAVFQLVFEPRVSRPRSWDSSVEVYLKVCQQELVPCSS